MTSAPPEITAGIVKTFDASIVPKLFTPPSVMPRFALSSTVPVCALSTPPSMTMLFATGPPGTKPSAASPVALVSCSVPFLIWIAFAPVRSSEPAFGPERVRLPKPCLINVPEPKIAPESAFAEVLKLVIVRVTPVPRLTMPDSVNEPAK